MGSETGGHSAMNWVTKVCGKIIPLPSTATPFVFNHLSFRYKLNSIDIEYEKLLLLMRKIQLGEISGTQPRLTVNKLYTCGIRYLYICIWKFLSEYDLSTRENFFSTCITDLDYKSLSPYYVLIQHRVFERGRRGITWFHYVNSPRVYQNRQNPILNFLLCECNPNTVLQKKKSSCARNATYILW